MTFRPPNIAAASEGPDTPPAGASQAQAAAPDPAEQAPAPHVLLLLAHRAQVEAAQSLLRGRLGHVQVSRASNLSEAMIACGLAPPLLSVLDSALCDALDREFVDHLLQAAPDARVLMLGTDSQSWPRHPRLVHASLVGLLPAIERWYTAWRSADPSAAPVPALD